MSRDLLHLGRGSSGSWVELVDEEARESVLSHQLHRLLEVLVRLSWKAADDVGGDGDAWNPMRNTSRNSMTWRSVITGVNWSYGCGVRGTKHNRIYFRLAFHCKDAFIHSHVRTDTPQREGKRCSWNK